jgi:hypothetical protein
MCPEVAMTKLNQHHENTRWWFNLPLITTISMSNISCTPTPTHFKFSLLLSIRSLHILYSWLSALLQRGPVRRMFIQKGLHGRVC